MKLIELAFDFIESSAKHTSCDALLDDFRARIGVFGLEHVIMSFLPVGESEVRHLVLLNGWPMDWFDRYVEHRYYLHDAVAQHAIRYHQPFFWDDVPQSLTESPMARQIAGEASSFGLSHGYLVPVYTSRTLQACISLGGAHRLELGEREEGTILLMAHYVNRAAKQLIGETPAHHRLTEREREVLRWVASGKTMWEVSVTLSISEATVEKHLASARRKMGVVNTTQSVAEALIRHEIAI